jgi:iron complex outermembrane receptor protein
MKLVLLLALAPLQAGVAQARADSGTIRVHVLWHSAPSVAVSVRSGTSSTRTNQLGDARLVLPSGLRTVVVGRLGLKPESVTVLIRANLDTSIVISLVDRVAEVERIVVVSTRTDQRIEDVPLRVEVLAQEEVEEKLMMTPGDISMMLNETGGLRVQNTSPSLGGASVRVQGLRGRYTLMLSDGLPLHGGQTGAIGLLQIPPMDLGQVEIIKGVASALYGSSAMGGVVNLISRRPREAPERELLLNATSREGFDAVLWDSRRLNDQLAYALVGGAHRQRANDVDGDGWADMAGYDRIVVRPRVFWNGASGRNAFGTIGVTLEDRQGGTMAGRLAPDGSTFVEGLSTGHFDGGGVLRLPFSSSVFSARASGSVNSHTHEFGVVERDRHETWFAEASLATSRGVTVGLLGAAVQLERYRSRDVSQFDYGYTIPALFAQAEADAGGRLAVSGSVRVDAHSHYGTMVNPRLSLLLRAPRAWTVRASAGTGSYAPTPLTEETEVTGLTPLRTLPSLRAERGQSASLDVGGHIASFEINATAFASRIAAALAVRPVAGSPGELEMLNETLPTRSAGADVLVRVRLAELVTTFSYTHIKSTEADVLGVARREVPQTPRHTAGLVSVWEREGLQRVGIEVYYTGRQQLDENPYLTESRPYIVFGAIAERRVGRARVFVNFENLGDVRMTRYQPLVLPARGLGGRWTTDAWAPLEGRTINAGVRLNALGGPVMDKTRR